MFGRIRSTSGSTKYLSTLAMAFALVMGIACYTSCGKPDEPKPVDPVNPTPPVEKDTKVPEITLKVTELNVYGGKVVTIEAGKLSIGETEVATWSDDKSAADKCTVTLSFTEATTKAESEADADTKAGTAIKSGDTLDKAGTLAITVTDEAGNKAEKGITLTAQGLFGLENLKNLDLQIDKEVSLLEGITTAEGWSIAKVEIETVDGTAGGSGTEGSRVEIPSPYKYTPTGTGTIRIIITITDGNKTAEFTSDEFTVTPLEYQAFTIEKAIFDKRLGLKVELIPEGEAYLDRKGVFETQALLVEMIEHGTSTMSAQEVKNLLSKNEIIYYGETFNDDTGFENLYEYMDGTEDIGMHGGHLSSIAKCLMVSTKSVSVKINKQMKIYNVRGDFEYQNLLKYVKSNPGHYYLVSASELVAANLNDWNSDFKAEKDALKELLKSPSVWKDMVAFGNHKNDYLSGRYMYEVIKDNEQDTDWRFYTSWSSGADGVMGSDNLGNTQSDTYSSKGGDWSSHPTKSHIGDDDLRSASSQLYGYVGEPSSEAVMMAMGAYWLSSLANQLANPSITKEQNNAKIRSEADDADVYVDDEYYGTTKSVNPGRTLEQFFPRTISTCSLSEGLVPLPSGLYKNSITVGPGCVDGSGAAVTADNYRDMTGRPLYISTALLRKMGRKAGDTLEYTTYLCTDGKGTGASDNASEAFKSICSRTFTLKLTE